MSASLVGSEMCIRDSPCTPKSKTLAEGRCKRNLHRRAISYRGKRGPQPPVSYTHLTLPTICSV
eukprot:13100533-Alexandrium_andersonii.AAC.1